MKINNRLIALLLVCVCLFASCSKDDGPELPQGPVEVVVSFAAVAEANATKATTEESTTTGSDTENFIEKLATFIFDKEGQLLGSSTKSTINNQSITEAEPVSIKIIKGEDNYTAVLVANYGSAFAPASIRTLDGLKAAIVTEDISVYSKNSRLPMVSKQILFSGTSLKTKEEGTNWIKESGGVATSATDPVKLQRLISRVDLEGVRIDFSKYPKAIIQIDSLALINVCSKATIEMGMGDTVKGHQYEFYKYDQDWIDPMSRIVKQLAGGGNWGSNGNTFRHGSYIEKANSLGFGWENVLFSSYLFSNKSTGKYKTALLISGWFRYDKEDAPKRRHYRVYLTDPDPSSKFQVRPNYLYKIKVTITGEGSDNEDKIEENANVAVEIVADPWNIKTQDVPGEI